MKNKSKSLLFIAAMLLAFALTTLSNAGTEEAILGSDEHPIVVQQALNKITMDGDPADWVNITTLPAPYSKKAAGLLKLAWREEGLYGCVQVAADKITADEENPWGGDCMELFLDTAGARTTYMGDNSYQLILAPTPAQGPGKCLLREAQGVLNYINQFQAIWKPTAGGYAMEFFVPVKEFSPFAQAMGNSLIAKMAVGKKISFNYCVIHGGKIVELFFDKDDWGWMMPSCWGVLVLGKGTDTSENEKGIVSPRPSPILPIAPDPDAALHKVPVPFVNSYKPGETIAIHQNLPTDCWPQLANTPQRTGYTPMKFDPPQGQVKWSVCLTDIDVGNRISSPVQPIIAEGRVYVGCKNGKLFALDAVTGEIKWTFQTNGPIVQTAGYYKGKVLVAAMDGCVYAVNAATGKQGWIFNNHRRHGFSTAVLLAEDKVFAVDRGGRLFALNAADGAELWHYDAGAPVDQSPAYDAGKVFFASEDMRVHAMRAADGIRLWKSEQLAGMSFRWFYPVVVNGKVIVRSLSTLGKDHNNILGYLDTSEQYTDPAKRSLFALDEDTGKESIVIKQNAMGHDGNQPPPAVTRDGLIIVSWCVARPYNDTYWTLEDIRTQQIVMPLVEAEKRLPEKSCPARNKPWFAGGGVGANENHIASVIGDMVMSMHHIGFYSGAGCFLGGAFDLVNWRWYVKISDSKGAGGWWSLGGDGNEDGGSNAMSAASGLMYHHDCRFHRITCYEPLTN